MKVSEIMSSRLFTCEEGDTLQRAAQIMWEEDVGCVPITRGKRVVGMLTDRDISMSAYLNGKSLDALRVGDVMSREIRACGPNDDVKVAEERMAKTQVRRLPVIENDCLVGLVSLNDLAVTAEKRKHPRLEDVGSTLAHICHHRRGNGGALQRVA